MKILGFPNLGNTCYINSVLQCFIYNNFFQKNCEIPELKKVIEQIDLNFNGDELFVNYNISNLINFFFEKKKCFKPFQQNDAHEFLIEFLDLLTQYNGLPIQVENNDSWNTFLKQNNYNPFIKEYHGQSKLNIICNKCKTSKNVFEEFNTINLDVPLYPSDVTSLFIKYLNKETVNDSKNLYYCDCCKSEVLSERKISLNVLPNILIIVLKRYSDNGTKIVSDVKYDKILSIRLGNDVKKYHLKSIINHYGNLYNGHYTSSIKLNEKWYNIDDNNINIGCDNNAYILFYSL